MTAYVWDPGKKLIPKVQILSQRAHNLVIATLGIRDVSKKELKFIFLKSHFNCQFHVYGRKAKEREMEQDRERVEREKDQRKVLAREKCWWGWAGGKGGSGAPAWPPVATVRAALLQLRTLGEPPCPLCTERRLSVRARCKSSSFMIKVGKQIDTWGAVEGDGEGFWNQNASVQIQPTTFCLCGLEQFAGPLLVRAVSTLRTVTTDSSVSMIGLWYYWAYLHGTQEAFGAKQVLWQYRNSLSSMW